MRNLLYICSISYCEVLHLHLIFIGKTGPFESVNSLFYILFFISTMAQLTLKRETKFLCMFVAVHALLIEQNRAIYIIYKHLITDIEYVVFAILSSCRSSDT